VNSRVRLTFQEYFRTSITESQRAIFDCHIANYIYDYMIKSIYKIYLTIFLKIDSKVPIPYENTKF